MNGWGWVGTITCLYLGGVGFGTGYSPLAGIHGEHHLPRTASELAALLAAHWSTATAVLPPRASELAGARLRRPSRQLAWSAAAIQFSMARGGREGGRCERVVDRIGLEGMRWWIDNLDVVGPASVMSVPVLAS